VEQEKRNEESKDVRKVFESEKVRFLKQEDAEKDPSTGSGSGFW
jgi:hypothetical protein